MTTIVKKPLDIPLTPNTQISFDWRYDAVPALGPETEQQFHDYVVENVAAYLAGEQAPAEAEARAKAEAEAAK